MTVPVVILCGGRGMRLGERTETLPKPMVEVGGVPILLHIMRMYAADGFKRFILCLGYKGDKIREHFVEATDWRGRDFTIDGVVSLHKSEIEDWSITFADTGLDTETGGRIKQVEKYLGDAPRFFVTYADGVSDLSVAKLLEKHERHGKLATMTCVRPRTHYGRVDLEPDGFVRAYQEKQTLAEFVNGGFFCFERGVLDRIHGNETLEREPLQRLVAEKQLMANAHPGFWACMDTPKDCQVLNDLWARGEAPWRR